MTDRRNGLGYGLRTSGLLAGRKPPPGRARLPHGKVGGGTPEENVKAFISQARTNPCWLSDVEFDDDCWDVTGAVNERPGRPPEPGQQLLWFCQARGIRDAREPLPPCIKNFCKAVVQQTRGARFQALKSRIEACSYLGAALEAEGCASVAGCNVTTLDLAADLAAQRLGSGKARNVGSQLQLIARFLDQQLMTSSFVGDWRSANLGTSIPADAVGKEERAADRLPADGYIASLGEAFQLAVLDTDVVVTSILALQCCGLGWRIDDVLNLPEDCDHGLDHGDTLALRCTGSKRVGPVVRDIPASMTSLARLALTRLRRITGPAHAIKRWYDKHPATLYLSPELEPLREKALLTMAEAAVLIGLSPQEALVYAHRHKMKLVAARGPQGGASYNVSFTSLQSHYVSQIPKRSRAAGGTDYDPLLIVPQGLFRRARSLTGSPCMYQAVTYDHIRSAMMPREGAPGMFKRLGVDCDRQGGDRTHAIRHFFATLARAHHVSGDDLAQVQGRVDARHNAHYEHFLDAAGQDLLLRVSDDLANGGGPADAEREKPSPAMRALEPASDQVASRLLHAQRLTPSRRGNARTVRRDT